MHLFKTVGLAFALGLVSLATAEDPPLLTYWVHSSCETDKYENENRKAKFTSALTEAINFANRGLARLQSSTDYLQARYFQRIFQAPVTDAGTVGKVTTVLEQLKGLTKIADQKLSNIRIYCDDDDYGPGKRWTLVPDIEGSMTDSDEPDNSRRTRGEDQEWEDKSNGIRMDPGTLGCKDEGDIPTLGETQYFPNNNPADQAGQNPERVALTLCDLSLERAEQATTDLPDGVSLEAKGTLENLARSLSSVTLFHEFVHHDAWDDLPAVEDEVLVEETDDHDAIIAYGWELLQMLPPEKAVTNVDNYAYFSLLAVLLDRGVRLYETDAGQALGLLKNDPQSISSKRKRAEGDDYNKNVSESTSKEGLKFNA